MLPSSTIWLLCGLLTFVSAEGQAAQRCFYRGGEWSGCEPPKTIRTREQKLVAGERGCSLKKVETKPCENREMSAKPVDKTELGGVIQPKPGPSNEDPILKDMEESLKGIKHVLDEGRKDEDTGADDTHRQEQTENGNDWKPNGYQRRHRDQNVESPEYPEGQRGNNRRGRRWPPGGRGPPGKYHHHRRRHHHHRHDGEVEKDLEDHEDPFDWKDHWHRHHHHHHQPHHHHLYRHPGGEENKDSQDREDQKYNDNNDLEDHDHRHHHHHHHPHFWHHHHDDDDKDAKRRDNDTITEGNSGGNSNNNNDDNGGKKNWDRKRHRLLGWYSKHRGHRHHHGDDHRDEAGNDIDTTTGVKGDNDGDKTIPEEKKHDGRRDWERSQERHQWRRKHDRGSKYDKNNGQPNPNDAPEKLVLEARPHG